MESHTTQQPDTSIKTFDEELGLKEIDQLGAATLQFANHCLEYKKLCAALIGAIPALLLKLTNNRLDTSIFVAALLIALAFWVLDAEAYLLQEKVRATMKSKANVLKQKRGGQSLIDGVGMPIVDRPPETRRRRSYFNSSQLPYFMLIGLDGILWLMFVFHWIG